MREYEVLGFISDLRKSRHSRSEEVMSRRKGAENRAGLRAKEAAAAIRAHSARIADEERAVAEALIGLPLNRLSLQRMQENIEKVVRDRIELEDRRVVAETISQDCKTRFLHARLFHARQTKGLVKLSTLIARLHARGASRKMAIAELADEEDTARTNAGRTVL